MNASRLRAVHENPSRSVCPKALICDSNPCHCVSNCVFGALPGDLSCFSLFLTDDSEGSRPLNPK